MKVNSETVDKLARLSRLHISENEKEIVRADLEKMILFVDKLRELDTEGLDPVLHMGTEVNCLREDQVRGSLSSEEALYNATDRLGDFFTVPKVIRK